MENWIEPIPITEEWLLKFGFECIDEVNRGFTKVINDSLREKLYCNPSGSCAIISELINYQDFLFMDAKINTVHKLQNLYFALTCEELVAE